MNVMKVAGHAAVGAVFTLLMMSIWFVSWKYFAMAVVVAVFSGGYVAAFDDRETNDQLRSQLNKANENLYKVNRELDTLKLELDTGIVTPSVTQLNEEVRYNKYGDPIQRSSHE